MEPKPVITIDGDLDLIGPVLQKTLQSKLKLLQKEGYSKDDKAFSSICNGVRFVNFRKSQSDAATPVYLHNIPCVHTYWTSCSTSGFYDKRVRSLIDDWIKKTNATQTTRMIVYCVTAEVRSHRSKYRVLRTHEAIEKMIIDDFYKDNCSVINLRLSSSNEERIADSFTEFVQELSRVCLSEFLRNVSDNEDKMKRIRSTRVPTGAVYSYLCNKLSLAVSHEMIRNPVLAGLHYSSITRDLENSITAQAQLGEVSEWLCKVRDVPITTWNHPSLLYPQNCWKDLSLIMDNKANLLQIWSLLFTRHVHILCSDANKTQQMPACLQISNCCISTLHSLARMINLLKVPIPGGVFNSWSFMTCMECLDSMMLNIDPEVLACTTSAMLIQIRADLWHYAWGKLRQVGLLCNLMPGLVMMEEHERTVDKICSGIVLPLYEDVSDENLGKKLVSILKSKEKFKDEFMSLGELVIGAFKMSGRRRMAFSIGTLMAEFHKDVGLVKEAETLLCDVTSLYSVGQWPQLSSSAYSILAHCQRKLREEDKEVNSLIVLVTTPTFSSAAHDPNKCMDQLMHIANVSKYQKLLSWEPLFDLESISTEPQGKHHYAISETISVKFKFFYFGPKSMDLTNVSFVLESEAQLASSVPTATDKMADTTDAADVYEEIPLDPGPVEEKLLGSRWIGGDEGSKIHKVYYSADEGGSEDILFTPGLQLTCPSLIIQPGTNTITVKGKLSTPGTYYPYHIILKSGALDFCSVVPRHKSKSCPLTVLHESVDINIALIPQFKDAALLTGVTTLCQLRVNTGEDTAIREGAELLVKSPPTIELEAIKDATLQNLHSLGLSIPEVFPSGTVCVPFDMTVLSAYEEEDCVLPQLDEVLTGDALLSWEHELEVWCQWLTPPHLAKIPLTVYEPFVFSHFERSAGGDKTFLQLTVVNSCPLPLVLLDHQLHTSSVELFGLIGDKPKVFYPGDSFSFIWQHRKGSNANLSSGISAVFSIDYHPKTEELTPQLSRTAKYRFKMSNMKTIYSLKCSSAHSLISPAQPITVNQTVIVTYTITNVTNDFRDTTQGLETLHYTISSDPAHWELNVAGVGSVQAPRIAQSVSFKIAATPKQPGMLPIPSCSLVLEGVVSEESSGGVVKELLTGARCYNTCDWHRVEVS